MLYILGAQGGAVGSGRATSRKVTDSIPDGVIGIFYRQNYAGCTIAWD
jgi:hypothetical protein